LKGELQTNWVLTEDQSLAEKSKETVRTKGARFRLDARNPL